MKRTLVIPALIALVLTAAGPSFGTRESPGNLAKLILGLDDPERAQAALSSLVTAGRRAVPYLVGEATEGSSLKARGWAIVGLARLGGEASARTLEGLYNSDSSPPLVRSWAAAARVRMAVSEEELLKLVPLASRFPAVMRPLRIRILADVDLTSDGRDGEQLSSLMKLSQRLPMLQSDLQPAILAAGAGPLTERMLSDEDGNVRRQAAGYLASLGLKQPGEVARVMLAKVAFDPSAESVPWHDGPLFIPGIGWNRRLARELVSELMAWLVWCDAHAKKAESQTIINNLRSVGLLRRAGMQMPSSNQLEAVGWLRAWGSSTGKWGVEELLDEQGLLEVPKYRKLLGELR